MDTHRSVQPRPGPRVPRPRRPPASGTPRPALTVILPCYNEAGRLPGTLSAYLEHLSRTPGEVEVLIVDDGSTDATVAVAEAAAATDPRVRVLCGARNRGKGFAVRTGMLAAAGELVLFTDADGSYAPEELDSVVRALAEAPVAIGTRAAAAPAPLTRRLASRAFNLAIRHAVGLPFHDTQGGLKGFRRAAAQEIFSRATIDGYAFDVEVLLLARRLGLEVVEVEVRAAERPGSKVRMSVDAQRMLREVLALRRAPLREVGGAAEPIRPPVAAAALRGR